MDWVYKPRVAAQIAQFVNYIASVPEAKIELERMAEQAADPSEAERLREVATSELVFPTDTSALHTYRELPTPEESRLWDQVFRPIYAPS